MPSTEPDRRPSALVWFAALASLVLPIIGVGAALYGVFGIYKGIAGGWIWLITGVLVLVADLIVDQKWSRWAASNEPHLNRRGDQLIGQIVAVVEPIERGGRGSVRAADSVWPAEGAEAARGARVRVTGCKGTVLTVELV
jgi:inner membrane protein